MRYDLFDNKNGEGEIFVEIDNMWVLCLGLFYDIDGEFKVFVNVGCYFFFVVSNINVCLLGNEYDVIIYYLLLGIFIEDFNGSEYLDYVKGD